MENLLKAQEELTKDLQNVKANEVPELLVFIDDIRSNSTLKCYSQKLLHIAALMHEIQAQEEHDKILKCIPNELMSNFFLYQQDFIKLLK